MNTGLLRHAVATVLTVYGIETIYILIFRTGNIFKLQQCLPFTVLKLAETIEICSDNIDSCNSAYRLRY